MKLFTLDGGWKGGFAVIAATVEDAQSAAEAHAAAMKNQASAGYLRNAIEMQGWEEHSITPGLVVVFEGEN